MRDIVRRSSPARRALATALVAVAAVLLVACMVAVWADDLLLSPGRWETTSSKLLANPTIRTSTATYLADQIDARLQLSRLPVAALGSVLGPVAGTSVASTQAAIFQAMDRALGLPSVQLLWAQANRGAATALLTVVDSPSGPPKVAVGSVGFGGLVVGVIAGLAGFVSNRRDPVVH